LTINLDEIGPEPENTGSINVGYTRIADAHDFVSATASHLAASFVRNNSQRTYGIECEFHYDVSAERLVGDDENATPHRHRPHA
jgi:hypothetical protein